jgi:metal-responsive CopG/Arc/MetJ family transcriptional regulator
MTVQIEIDEKTLSEVDEAIKVLGEDREEVFRQTFLDLAKRKKREAEVARQYAEAYRKHPQTAEEIEEWEEVQHWENE